jgi:uncharacterized membrane protein YbhN (UPF0104 family)
VPGRLLSLLRRRRVVVALQLLFVGILLGSLAYALRDAWGDAIPRLRDARPLELLGALGVLALYYLMFVVGWQWILRDVGVRVSYGVALQAEMASMLAKYIPGGVWTPMARILWLRRFGIDRTSLVLGSILLEAGLSAVSGVLVFVLGLAFVDAVDPPLALLVAFAALVLALIHPRVFVPLSGWIFRRFGGTAAPALRYRAMLELLVFYSASWLVGGAALLLMLRALGEDVGLVAIPYLGGTAAVGAIVSVLTFVAPSGLGVREGSTYGLLLAVTSAGIALGVTIVNRVAITLVEALLLALAVLVWGVGRRARGEADARVWREPELDPRSP